jgi:predicted Zn-dependent peptidase
LFLGEAMFNKFAIKNGMNAISVPMRGTETICLLVLFGVGSRYEAEAISGISHFLEHMFFKGTKKYPTTLALSSEIESIGAEFNAFTSKEFTGYYIKAPKENFEKMAAMLSEMLQKPLMRETDIKKEKGVIIQELKMYEDEPRRYVEDLFEQVVYGDHPLGRMVIGDENTIQKINKKDIIQYLQNNYTQQNSLIIAAGALPENKKIQNLLSKYFAKIFKSETAQYLAADNMHRDQQIIRLHPKKTKQTHFCLGFPGFDVNHPDKYILKLIATILGGGMSSRLFIRIRDQHGLAYYIRSMTQNYRDTGYIVINAGVDSTKFFKALKMIREELEKIAKIKVSEKELSRAKEIFYGRMVIDLEDSFELAGFYGLQNLLAEQTKTVEDLRKIINQINGDDIQRVAREVFDFSKVKFASIGPQKDQGKIEKIFNCHREPR